MDSRKTQGYFRSDPATEDKVKRPSFAAVLKKRPALQWAAIAAAVLVLLVLIAGLKGSTQSTPVEADADKALEASSGSVALADGSTTTEKIVTTTSKEDEDERGPDTEAGRSKTSLGQDSDEKKEESREDKDLEEKIDGNAKAESDEKSEENVRDGREEKSEGEEKEKEEGESNAAEKREGGTEEGEEDSSNKATAAQGDEGEGSEEKKGEDGDEAELKKGGEAGEDVESKKGEDGEEVEVKKGKDEEEGSSSKGEASEEGSESGELAKSEAEEGRENSPEGGSSSSDSGSSGESSSEEESSEGKSSEGKRGEGESSEGGSSEESGSPSSGETGTQQTTVAQQEVKATAAAIDTDPEDEPTPEECKGRMLHIHHLPRIYNRGIVEQCRTLLPWYSMCPHLQNFGLGTKMRPGELVPFGRWFETHTYALEVVFHYRLRKTYKCITTDPEKADLFFIPFYASLEVLRWHFDPKATEKQREKMHNGLARWLLRRPQFQASGGSNHFIVLGQGTWDFRRTEGSKWGNRLLLLPEMKNVTKLVLEAHLWEKTEIAIPPISFFHPRKEKDYQTWQRQLHNANRTYLASFATLRDFFPAPSKALQRMCQDHKASCRLLECAEGICDRPEVMMGLYMQSTFCIMAPGWLPARRAAFDALLAGCIPVMLDDFLSKQYKLHLPARADSYQVVFPREAVEKEEVDVMEKLEEMTAEQIRDLRATIIERVMPALAYNHPNMFAMPTHDDAFDIAMREIEKRILKTGVKRGGGGNTDDAEE